MSQKKSVIFDESKNEVKELSKEDSKGKKHTLDSDEEDIVEDYDRLDEDDIEGQEDATIVSDGNIAIMPFNMKEEMQTGHFDASGTYIFDKEDEIKDGWMDNIDWSRVKQKGKKEGETEEENDEMSDGSDEISEVDFISFYREMLTLMKPGESVAKSLRRHGGGNKKISSAQRWKAKKQKTEPTPEEKEAKEKFQKLTDLADRLIQTGYMEIYEDSYEKISYKIDQADQASEAAKTQIPDGADDDDALDMFADSFDKIPGKESKTQESKTSKQSSTKTSDAKESGDKPNELMWEYKKENTEESEVVGPYTSEQMLERQESGTFEGDVFVRKIGTESSFYSSRRIDFDLYT